MKTEQLLRFKYTNAATTYLVRATEYTDFASMACPIWRVTTIDGEVSRTLCPESRAQAILLAEAAVKAFVERMHIIYGVD